MIEAKFLELRAISEILFELVFSKKKNVYQNFPYYFASNIRHKIHQYG